MMVGVHDSFINGTLSASKTALGKQMAVKRKTIIEQKLSKQANAFHRKQTALPYGLNWLKTTPANCPAKLRR